MHIAMFVVSFFIVTKVVQGAGLKDYTSLKTVTFGDESAVRPNRAAGIISILTFVGVVVLFLLYVASTGGASRFGLACSAFTKTLKDLVS